MVEEEVQIDLSKLKKIKSTYVFLILFILIGFSLRVYNIDFPAIGYHNMKENEYLDQAVFYTHDLSLLHKKAFAFFGLDEGVGYHEEYGQAPLIPYMVLILWKIFGQQLWPARLLIILFSLGSILLTYHVVKRLTNNEYLSLLSSFFFTIMPLGIYFGRNVQPDMPAVFFGLLGMYFFFKWLDEDKTKNVFYTTLFLGISALLKYQIFIMAFPLLFVFPYKKIYNMLIEKKKEFWKTTGSAFAGFLPLIIGVAVFEFLTIVDPTKKNYVVDPFRIFTYDFWAPRIPIINSFIRDNYTWWFVWFAIIGFAFVLMKRNTRFAKFIIGYVIAIPVYVALVSEKIAGHSYYQLPFLPLICILSAYFFFILGTIAKQALNNKYVLFVPLLILLLTASEMRDANDRVWSTVFYGQDVAGNWIKERTQWGDRLIDFTVNAQAYAVCSYSERSCGSVNSITELHHKEEVFNIPYIYVDPSSISHFNQTMMDYVFSNYRIVYVGAVKSGDGLVPVQYILKKGGKFNLTEMQTKPVKLAETYNLPRGKVEYYVIENE